MASKLQVQAKYLELGYKLDELPFLFNSFIKGKDLKDPKLATLFSENENAVYALSEGVLAKGIDPNKTLKSFLDKYIKLGNTLEELPSLFNFYLSGKDLHDNKLEQLFEDNELTAFIASENILNESLDYNEKNIIHFSSIGLTTGLVSEAKSIVTYFTIVKDEVEAVKDGLKKIADESGVSNILDKLKDNKTGKSDKEDKPRGVNKAAFDIPAKEDKWKSVEDAKSYARKFMKSYYGGQYDEDLTDSVAEGLWDKYKGDPVKVKNALTNSAR